MHKTETMRHALDSADLFDGILSGDTWKTWRVILIAAMGEKLTWRERRTFEKVTGRKREPGEMVDHLVALVGRRGGKSRAASVLAVYLAALCDYSSVAAPGERLRVLFLAKNQRQAGVCFSYCAGIFDSVPALADSVINRTQDTISLSNGVDLEIMAASASGIRGVTAVAVIADEACHWLTDSEAGNADTEILNAARPSLATTGGPLIVISSVYARRGETFDLYDKHFGPKGDPRILVALGTSRDFNSSLPQSVVDRAIERDSAANSAEYLSIWRDDLENFVTLETIRACTGPLRVREPVPGVSYVAGIDFAGGSGQDSLALAFCHYDATSEKIIVDMVHEWKPPFSPSETIREVAILCHHFGIDTVIGDRWGGDFPREAVRQWNLDYRISDKTTSDCFAALLPIMNSREVELPKHPEALAQIGALQRRPTASGRDKIGHPQNGNAHDDMAAAIAVAVAHCAFGQTKKVHWFGCAADGTLYGEHTQHPVIYARPPNTFETY